MQKLQKVKLIMNLKMHSELPEDWTDCKAPVIEGITFYCKYLGSTLIEEPSSETLTADAIKRIISMV